MARSKKPSRGYQAIPSLFDDLDLAPEIPDLPGLDRHIRAARATIDRRTATRIPDTDPLPPQPEKIHFISFGSGSSGNCTFIGTSGQGFLIDAGIDFLAVEKELTRNGIPLQAIKGIILTHDHGDHVRYAYAMLRRHRDMLLYCTPRTLNGILRRHNISRRIKDFHHPIYKETPFSLAGFTITAFDVDHDGTDNAGYHITRPGFTFTVATDLGNIGPRADHYLRLADHIMIESNYDADMLRRGVYPEYLKARIIAPNGHLDNAVTAAYLASIYHPGLKHIFLCHLSNDNNTPAIALDAVSRALSAIGITVGDGSNSPLALNADIQLQALPRYDSTGLITLRSRK